MSIIITIRTDWIKAKKDAIIYWIKARSAEKSTWEGIIIGASIICSWIKPEYKEVILSGAGGIWSIIRILTEDATHGVGKVLETIVEAHDEVKTIPLDTFSITTNPINNNDNHQSY